MSYRQCDIPEAGRSQSLDSYRSTLCLVEEGRIREALSLYEQLLADPSLDRALRANVYNDLGVIASRLTKPEEAEKLFRKAIFANTLCHQAYHNLISVTSHRIHKEHLFSIVMPTYNRCSDLKECVKSLRENSCFPIEIVIVADPCHDGTVEYLEKEETATDIVCIVNKTHLGTTRSTNRGLNVASGDYVGIINDDVLVMPGWDLAIVDTIDDDPLAGCAAPLVIHPNGTIQSVGVHNNFRSAIHDWVGNVSFLDISPALGAHIEAFPELQVKRECDYSYFPIMKRECFEKVGSVDEQFKHYFADPDIGLRVQQAGYNIVYCPTSVFAHYELSRKDPQKQQKRFDHDWAQFEIKWQLYQLPSLNT